jgi:hypothetical protein
MDPMYLVHLDSADKQTISRGKRGCNPCKALLLFSPSAERGSEKRLATHAGMALRDSRG